jgi:hypothetical protein
MSIDHTASALGRPQFGLVARRQFRDEGIDHRAVRRRLDAEVWTEPVPHVIDLGTHEPSWSQSLMQVVLAAGPAAVVSHHCAAFLHGFLDVEEPAKIDVTVPRSQHSAVAGVRLHTPRAPLADDEIVEVAQFRCTSTARTLVDLAPLLAPRRLESILWEAARHDGDLASACADLLARRPRIRGKRVLLGLLTEMHPEVGQLASPLEVNGILGLRRVGTPPPMVQYEIRDESGRFVARVDAAWPAGRIIVEFDGAAYHEHPSARHRDRERLARIRALGWEVHVLTAADLRTPARLRRVARRVCERSR